MSYKLKGSHKKNYQQQQTKLMVETKRCMILPKNLKLIEKEKRAQTRNKKIYNEIRRM